MKKLNPMRKPAMKAISFSRPTISKQDLTKVLECLVAEDIAQGNIVKQLKLKLEEILNSKAKVTLTHSVSLSLYMIYQDIGLGEGDEVIVSPLAEKFVPELAKYLGAKVLWVDLKKDKLALDLDHLSSLLSKKTKVIVLPHFYGYPYSDLSGDSSGDSSLENLREKIKLSDDIKIVEDLSSSLGTIEKDSFLEIKKNAKKNGKGKLLFSNLKQVGGDYDYAFFSLESDKIITSGKGGVTISNKPLFNNSLNKDNEKNKAAAKPGETNALHNTLPRSIPFDWAMGDLGAALALSELTLLPKIVNKRKEIASYYQKTLENSEYSPLIPVEHGFYNFSHYPIWVDKKFSLAKQVFLKHNVQVRDLSSENSWKSLTTQEKAGLPNLRSLVNEVIFLPIYPTLNVSEIERITKLLRIKI